MNTNTTKKRFSVLWPLILLAAWPAVAWTQSPGEEIQEIEEFTELSSSELEELIGAIALYPDDLLAIVLPASTFPLQVVEAARFLEALEDDSTLKPDEDWDDSIVALLNYPEIVELLNSDLDWTWRLGEAVVAQQSDVIAAIELFRDRAYAAGNLESDENQVVSHEDGAIQITPVEEDVIYVPYYEPEEVIVYQPRRVYYYHPRAYPVYYYPYPSHHVFHHRHFWGVTTAFTIGWHLHHLNVFHHSFYGHPYYGYSYWDRWWYRRPDIHIYNNYYVRNVGRNYNRYRYGDRWYPNVRSTIRHSDRRVTRTRYYPSNDSSRRNDNVRSNNTTFAPSRDRVRAATDRAERRRDEPRGDITFRERPSTPSVDRSSRNRTSVTRDPVRTARPTRPSSREPSTRVTRSRPDTTRATTTRPSTQPRFSTSRQAPEPRTSRNRVTREPRANVRPSRPSSPPRANTSRPSQPKVSSSRSSQAREPKSESSRQSRDRSGRRESQRRR